MERFLDTLWSVITVIGVLYLLQSALRLLRGLAGMVHTYLLSSGADLRDYGPWAVVTGASEGIGRGYALELARRGLNVAILSRSREKLEKVAKEIREIHRREALVVPVDFTQGQTVYDRLRNELDHLEVGLIVNNVGLSHKFAQYFLEVGQQRAREMVELNCQAMVHMTHLFLPGMVQRGRGAVINISSYLSSHPQPLLGLYSATKKFVNFFSAALNEEYASRGILVQTVMPHLVSTAMTKMRRNIFVPTGMAYARAAVSTIGVESATYGCLPHAVVCSLTQLTPDFVRSRVLFTALSYSRSRYFRLTSHKK